MTEKRCGDLDSWFLRNDDTAIVYMCWTDWEHHTLSDADGTTFYPSIRALKKHRKCWKECGIIEVGINFRQWIQPQEYPLLRAEVWTKESPTATEIES